MKTNMRQTSIEAYDEMKKNGREQTVTGIILAAIISASRPVTRLELSKLTGTPINSVAGRVHTLINDSAVRESGRIICPVSGNSVIGVEAIMPDEEWQPGLF